MPRTFTLVVAALLLANVPLCAQEAEAEAPHPDQAQRPWSTALGVGLGYGFPLSRFYENFDSGLQYGGDEGEGRASSSGCRRGC